MARAQQKRVIETRAKILDGLERLLELHEFEAISIAQLAREAGVAVGSVYSHFRDKDALLPALLERHVMRAEERLSELRNTGTVAGIGSHDVEASDLRSSIELSIRTTLRQIQDSLGVRRALLTYRRLNPEAELPIARKLTRQALEALVEQLQKCRDEIAHQDVREAARMVNYFLNILFLDRIVFLDSTLQEELRPDDEVLIKTYTFMLYSWLTGTSGNSSQCS